MSLDGRKILVIGGTGFIGGRLAERLLLERGADVRVTVRDWRKAVWIARSRAELVEGDVTDLASIRAAASGCELVFHCASGPADDGGYMRTNRDGTGNVIQACRDAGVRRLVYVSTVAVHGVRPGLQLSESTPVLRTGRDYNDSKIEAERLLAESRLETVIVRPTYVWGPRSNAFTTRQVREMLAGSFVYVDRGEHPANAVYVDNLVDALIAAAESAEAAGRRYLVTDGAPYTWHDLFDGYARVLGISDFRSIPSRSRRARIGARALVGAERALAVLQGPRSLPVRAIRRVAKIGRDALRRRYVDAFELDKFACDELADIEAARRDLGYAPRVSLEEGLAWTRGWIEDQFGSEIEAWRREREDSV